MLNEYRRVPAVAQWVKNLTAVAQVVVEARVRSLARELPYASGTATGKKKRRKIRVSDKTCKYTRVYTHGSERV